MQQCSRQPILSKNSAVLENYYYQAVKACSKYENKLCEQILLLIELNHIHQDRETCYG